MRLAVISDLHLGEPRCSLVAKEGGQWRTEVGFERLTAACGQDNAYLVILGDALDFSVADYADVYGAAAAFFRQVAQARLAKRILYVPGNHDHTLWHIATHEANVIDQINEGKPPRTRPTVAAVFDHHKDAEADVVLANVKPKPDGSYGGLFLDKLAWPDAIPFVVAYPNLYVVDARGTATLLSHGHYLESFWALTLDLSRHVFGQDLVLEGQEQPGIRDVVTVNFPLGELASSGIGQAGALTPLLRRIQAAASQSNPNAILPYIDALFGHLDQEIAFKGWSGWFKKKASGYVLERVKQRLVDWLRSPESTTSRDKPGFPSSQRLEAYLVSSMLEAAAIREEQGIDIPVPVRMVLGHSHVSIRLGKRRQVSTALGRAIDVVNTGGWLGSPQADGTVDRTKLDALVLKYDSSAAAPNPCWTDVVV
ncbi:MAG: metallophosphoesterase [Deltaproteobacteria bacterium]|nr:metallophosphoesterase [Deltaproteobacteria bacterium]